MLLNVFILHKEVAKDVNKETDFHNGVDHLHDFVLRWAKASVVSRTEGADECEDDHDKLIDLDPSALTSQDKDVACISLLTLHMRALHLVAIEYLLLL